MKTAPDRRRLLQAASAAAGLCALPWARGQGAAGARPVRLVHGFAAGGNADAIARVLAQPLGTAQGRPVVVEARPGAGGAIAAEQVSRAAPDGSTLILLTGGHSVAAAFRPQLAGQAVDGFSMLSLVASYPFSLLVRSDARWRSLADLLRESRDKPGGITFGSAGSGTTQHLCGELLATQAGVQWRHVPYKGGAAMMNDLLGGQIDVGIDSPVAGLPHVRSNRLLPLAVTRRQRWRLLPQTPTVEEAGVDGVDVGSWAGLAGPRGMSADLVAQLNSQVHAALQISEVRARLEALGAEVTPGTPGSMRTSIQAEIRQWAGLIRAARIEAPI